MGDGVVAMGKKNGVAALARAVEPKPLKGARAQATLQTLHEVIAPPAAADEAAKLFGLLTDREALKVLHRSLYDTGWHLRWGYEKHRALTRALDAFFGDDREHLRSR